MVWGLRCFSEGVALVLEAPRRAPFEGLGLSRTLTAFELWRPSRLEPGGPVQMNRCKVWVGLEASSSDGGWLDASIPERLDLCRRGGCKVWAESGSVFFFEMKPWLEAVMPRTT